MKILAYAFAGACLLAAAIGASDYAMLGFPDGHLTAYESETRGWRLAAIAGNLLLALGGIVIGAGWARLPRAALWSLAIAGIAFAAMPALVFPNCPGIAACTALYEAVTGHPPDHGIGG